MCASCKFQEESLALQKKQLETIRDQESRERLVQIQGETDKLFADTGKFISGSGGLIKSLLMLAFFPLVLTYWGFKNYPKQTTWVFVIAIIYGIIKETYLFLSTFNWWQLTLLGIVLLAFLVTLPKIIEGYKGARNKDDTSD
jgi:hypothetical protein